MKTCTICHSAGTSLLRLARQPIYQHPVPPGVEVAEPHAVDLHWLECEDCAHAWQPSFDPDLLARIYRSYYYTPAPDGIAVQFREDFLQTIERFGLVRADAVLLEIGASSGDVLAELKKRTGAARAYAFEPDSANAVVARGRGLEVYEEFFGAALAGRDFPLANLIYARHVIEHVFDFTDFFAGLRAVSAADADLVLETPSLDHSASGEIDPFHVEHVHVFALRSLARLGALNGWGLRDWFVSSSGNLIAWFRRGAQAPEIARPDLSGLQRSVDERFARLRSLLCHRELVFWGSGSLGLYLAMILGREPDIWTDGNPAKEGKHFIGMKGVVVGPAVAFDRARSGAMANPALVITSAFVAEILPRVRELGWRGEIFDVEGKLL